MTQTRTAKLILATMLAALTAGSAFAAEPNHRHHGLARDVDAFHSVLAPVWHARPGPERLKNACTQVEEMARLAGVIQSADTSQLIASIASLRTACQGKPSDVDAALRDVHERFHQLIDAKSGSARP